MSTPYLKNEPITSRNGNTLARAYGYPNVESIAASFTPGAQIIDVGAGWSTLGKEVCELRTDIQWTNADQAYPLTSNKNTVSRANRSRFERLASDAPANLRFDHADVLGIAERYGDGAFDDVFSYFMLGHITLSSEALGNTAAENMLRIAKETGRIGIGPVRKPWPSLDTIFYRAVIFKKDALDIQGQAIWITDMTRFLTIERRLILGMHRLLSSS